MYCLFGFMQLLFVVFCLIGNDDACVKPLRHSKEWQIRLRPELFTSRESNVKSFLDFVDNLQANFNIKIKSKKASQDTRQIVVYDTPDRILARDSIQFQVRSWRNSQSTADPAAQIKLKLRYNTSQEAVNAPLESSPNFSSGDVMECEAKLEQDIYPNLQRFAFTSKMSSNGFQSNPTFHTVGQIGAIYPDFLAELIRKHPSVNPMTNLEQSTSYTWVLEDISIKLNGVKLSSESVTIKYNRLADLQSPDSLPSSVEFSWKQKSTKENWNCQTWQDSRNFMALLVASNWTVDSSCCAVDFTGCDIQENVEDDDASSEDDD